MCCMCAYKSAELFFPGSTVSKLPFKVSGPRDLSQWYNSVLREEKRWHARQWAFKGLLRHNSPAQSRRTC